MCEKVSGRSRKIENWSTHQISISQYLEANINISLKTNTSYDLIFHNLIWILERVNLISKQYSTSIKGISNAKFTYRINCLSTHIIANEFCCFFTFHAHQYETLWLWLGDTTYLSYWILVYQGISGLLSFKILILTTICFYSSFLVGKFLLH